MSGIFPELSLRCQATQAGPCMIRPGYSMPRIQMKAKARRRLITFAGTPISERIKVDRTDHTHDEELRASVATSLEMMAPPADSETFRRQLEAHVNDLILHRFDYLISLLYRMDVSEKRLRELLEKNPSVDAGKIIADLVMERQARKMRSRREFRQQNDDRDENERW